MFYKQKCAVKVFQLKHKIVIIESNHQLMPAAGREDDIINNLANLKLAASPAKSGEHSSK